MVHDRMPKSEKERRKEEERSPRERENLIGKDLLNRSRM